MTTGPRICESRDTSPPCKVQDLPQDGKQRQKQTHTSSPFIPFLGGPVQLLSKERTPVPVPHVSVLLTLSGNRKGLYLHVDDAGFEKPLLSDLISSPRTLNPGRLVLT